MKITIDSGLYVKNIQESFLNTCNLVKAKGKMSASFTQDKLNLWNQVPQSSTVIPASDERHTK